MWANFQPYCRKISFIRRFRVFYQTGASEDDFRKVKMMEFYSRVVLETSRCTGFMLEWYLLVSLYSHLHVTSTYAVLYRIYLTNTPIRSLTIYVIIFSPLLASFLFTYILRTLIRLGPRCVINRIMRHVTTSVIVV